MDQTFHAIIEVVNRASEPIHRIEADFYSLIAPITAVGVAVSALAEETGIAELGEHAAIAMEKVTDLGRELGALVAPIALIGGLASAEGLLEVGKKTAEFGEQLLHSHEKTGVDIPVLARLHYVAKMEDVDPGQFDKALERLNANLFNAMHGKNKDLNAMMTHFEGPNWRGHVRSVEDGMGAIADAYNKASTPFTKAAVLATAFGQRMGANLAPMLQLGRDRLKELGDEFERFNGVWDEGRAKEATEAAESWKELSGAMEGLSNTIGSAVTPAMMSVIKPLTDWIANNRELVAARVDRFVEQVGDALKNVDWAGIGNAIGDVWSAFRGLGDLLGARGMVFLGAAVIFGPIAKSAAEAAIAVGSLAVQLGLSAIRLGAIVGLQVAGFFGDLVTGIRLAIPALDALDLAMDANPIGVISLAILGLAALAYELYEHWEPIGQWFGDLWTGITIVFDRAMNALRAALAPVGRFFSEVWRGIADEVQSVWRVIEPIFDKVGDFLARVGSIIGHAVVAGALAMPGVAQAAEVVHGVQEIHDMGQHAREARQARTSIERGALVDRSRGALAGMAGAGRLQLGQADINVNFDNVPRGTQVDVQQRGGGLNVKVGKSFAHE